jgi:hypothetical protein
MSSSLTPLDISNISELIRMAEEVNNTKTSRVLTVSRRTLAVLMPVETAGKFKEKRGKTKDDYDAFFSAFGSWKDVDTDNLLRNISATRKRSNHPPIEL